MFNVSDMVLDTSIEYCLYIPSQKLEISAWDEVKDLSIGDSIILLKERYKVIDKILVYRYEEFRGSSSSNTSTMYIDIEKAE